MTKPIILPKICYKLLYVIQVRSLKTYLTSWPQLISKFLVAHMYVFRLLLLIDLTFFTPRVFLFSIYHYFLIG